MNDRFLGVGPDSGVPSVDFCAVGRAYGLPVVRIDDKSEIEEKTPELLELYRSYINKLSPVVGDENEDDSEKPVIPESELTDAFSAIKEFVSGSYFDSADDIMNMLGEYKIPDEYVEKYEKVKRLMAAVDRDGLLNIL